MMALIGHMILKCCIEGIKEMSHLKLVEIVVKIIQIAKLNMTEHKKPHPVCTSINWARFSSVELSPSS